MISLPRHTVDLANRLAAANHVSVEEAIRVALEEKARAEGVETDRRSSRDQSDEATAERRARTDSFVATLAFLPILDRRSPHKIMDDFDAR